MNNKSLWESYNKDLLEEAQAFCEKYKNHISNCKTERECVLQIIKESEEKGYKNLDTIIENGEKLKAGDKIYANNRDKTVILFNIGIEGFESGLSILGAHLDSPRIDLKQNPLYEEAQLAMFKTHYYGGIRKYQWVALPLALHGVIVKKDGTKINIVIGEEETDPVIGISDLLPHLAKDQGNKKLNLAYTGEDLNVCVGSIPFDTEDEEIKEKVKKNILSLFKEKYGIDAKDFYSSELMVVPAGKARDYGLDRSMIIGYGQDDRVCSYTAFEAMTRVENPTKTTVTLLVDKEEIGSVGTTGMKSRFFENCLAEVMEAAGAYSELNLRRCLRRSITLSSDVCAGFDPNYKEVFEKNNASYLSRGIVLRKFTGSRGKSGSNDATAEYIAKLRKILDDRDIKWQMSEGGKVDQGGGGTIAHIIAEYDMDVIDAGVSIHNMHAPWEITSKVDVYETVRAYIAFLEEA